MMDNLLKDYAGTHYTWDERGNLIERNRNGEKTTFTWDGYNRKTHLGPGKYFSVGRYGAGAKQLAIAEREKQLRQMVGLSTPHPAEAVLRKAPRPRERPDGPSPVSRSELIRSNNKSGISGVQFRYPSGRENNPGIWVAQTYMGNGEARIKSFAISKYGEKKAKALAIAERERQLELKRKIQSARSSALKKDGGRSV